MSSRKHPSSVSPLAGRSSKSPTISAEYIEAIQTLNENTLSQACKWLLDENDTEAPDRILEAYFRCESALKVIRKNQPAANSSSPSSSLPPGVPNLNAPNLGSRIASRGSLQKMAGLAGKKHMAINKGGVIPIRRTAMNKPVGRKIESDVHNQSSHGLQVQHHHSTQQVQAQHLQHVAKKARMSPPIPDNPEAPPQAALSFLKKLNKDCGGNSGINTSTSNASEQGSGGSTTTRASTSTSNSTAKKSSIHTLHRRSSS